MDMSKLNPKQKSAVTCELGPVLVIAGAGSGKTKVLTMRYTYLIDHFKLDPSQILAITFTNKAALEMKTRLKSMIDENYAFYWVGTFHGICLKILKQDIHHLGRSNDFNIIDDDDQVSIFKEAYKLYKIDIKDIQFQQIFNILDKYKRNHMTISEVKEESNWQFLNIKNFRDCFNKCNVIQFYEKFCSANNLLDFNDLLIITNKLFQITEIREKWANKFKYILVDEFQDTNDEQYQFIYNLCGEHQNIFAVGDPDQMIYSWRGAKQAIINNFTKEFTNAKTIVMDINYRSTQEILNAANNLINFNKQRIKKELSAFNGSGNKPIYFHNDSQDGESRWVASKILTLINNGIKPEEIAILYRSNYLSRNIEQTLISNGIKYKIFGGLKFYQRKEIKDIVAYLKALYTADELSIKRVINVPKRGIGSTSIDLIDSYAKTHNISFIQALYNCENIEQLSRSSKNSIIEFIQILSSVNLKQSLFNIFEDVLAKTKYIEYLKSIEELTKIDNISELGNSIRQYENENPNNSFSDYLQEISLYTDHNDNNTSAVSLMTVHISKGLEFDNVFIIGLNEELFPSKLSLINNDAIEEERRTAYVAITRAKKNLYISSYSGINMINNSVNRKSRFIEEIGSNNFEFDKINFIKLNNNTDSWYDASAVPKMDLSEQYNSEIIDYKIGNKIIHTTFGMGHVIAINNNELTILFKAPYNKKILLANHKSIKRLLN